MTCFHETINFQSSLLNKISISSNENYESYQTLLPFYLLIYLKDAYLLHKNSLNALKYIEEGVV